LNGRAAVWLAVFSTTLSSNMIIPVIGLYTSLVLGAGPVVVGLVYGIGTLTSFFFRVPAATLSGRYGLKTTMASGMGLTMLGSLVYGFSTTPIHMVFGSLLRGLGSALFFPSALSTIYEEVGEGEDGARSLGYMLTAPAMGMVLGPVAGAVVLPSFGYQLTFHTSAAISFGGLLALRSMKENGVAGAVGGWRRPLQNPRFRSLLASRFLVNYVTGTVSAFLPLAVKTALNYEEHLILLLFSAGALANLLSRIVMGSVSTRYGAEKYILTGSALLASSSALFSFLNPITAWAGMVVYGFGMGVFVLGSLYLTGKLLPHEARTMGFALLTLTIDTGNALGNFLSGIFLSLAGFAEVFLAAAAFAAVGATVDLVSRRTYGRQEKPSPASPV
jgi:MFS family permease